MCTKEYLDKLCKKIYTDIDIEYFMAGNFGNFAIFSIVGNKFHHLKKGGSVMEQK